MSLHYGLFLKGTGKCWSRKFSLNEVDGSVPTSSGKGPVFLARRTLIPDKGLRTSSAKRRNNIRCFTKIQVCGANA